MGTESKNHKLGLQCCTGSARLASRANSVSEKEKAKFHGRRQSHRSAAGFWDSSSIVVLRHCCEAAVSFENVFTVFLRWAVKYMQSFQGLGLISQHRLPQSKMLWILKGPV